MAALALPPAIIRPITCLPPTAEGSRKVHLRAGTQKIEVFYNDRDGNFYDAVQKACTTVDARLTVEVMGTERLALGRWKIVSVGADAPTV